MTLTSRRHRHHFGPLGDAGRKKSPQDGADLNRAGIRFRPYDDDDGPLAIMC